LIPFDDCVHGATVKFVRSITFTVWVLDVFVEPLHNWHMTQRKLTAIVLAAGKGTRMKSALPKVLHPAAGIPILSRVINALQEAGVSEIRAVVGYSHQLIKQVIEPLGVNTFLQEKQLGTANAVQAAKPEDIEGLALIINGDQPLVTPEDLNQVVSEFIDKKADLAVVTVKLKDAKHYGRVVRENDRLKAIVEAKDADSDILKINEINTGVYILKADVLKQLLPRIENNNSQGEYYLTDIIELATKENLKTIPIVGSKRISFGVNTQKELAQANRILFRRKANQLMEEGVVIIDPEHTYIEDTVEIGTSTVIYPNCYLRGRTQVGRFCAIEPNCYIVQSTIEDSCQIRSGCFVEATTIKAKSLLQPNSVLSENAPVEEQEEMEH
jgi:bifunctional UDP-N-acetylglucosamine pyrophosphorylase/glucosamine-1-phosphate N-acetyltransferase